MIKPYGTVAERRPGARKAKDGRSTQEDAEVQLAPRTPADEVSDLSGDPNFMTSFARGLSVISAFATNKRGATMADLSRKTGLPRAVVRRCLYTLAQMGYAESDGRLFSLRPKILSLGYSYLSSAPLPETAQPFLDQISEKLHESSSLAVLDSDEVLYLARSATRRIMSVALNVGSRLPAYCTSMGRVLLAYRSAAEIDDYFSRVKPQPLTPKTVTAKSQLKKILASVREAGYSIVDDELEIGLRSLAVPVQDASGDVVAAMNVSTQSARVSIKELESAFLPMLRAAADQMRMLLLPR